MQKGVTVNNRSLVAFGMVMLVIGVGLAFYWYEYRPSRIRATCETQSIEQAQAFLKDLMGKKAPRGMPEGMFVQANKEAYYLSCVREQGLER
jgi:hypothetical protein